MGGVFGIGCIIDIPKKDLHPDEIASIRETPLTLYVGAKNRNLPLTMMKDSFKYLERIYRETENVLEIHYDQDLDNRISSKVIDTISKWLLKRL